MRLNADLTRAEQQEVRGGITVNVPVTSSVPTVGTITVSPVAMRAVADGGVSAGTTEFDPVSGGTTTLTVVAPVGFATPTVSGTYYYHSA